MTVRADVWPAARDYLDTVRDPRSSLRSRPELSGGILRDGPTPGLPWSASGANAIVFSLTVGSARRIAVRCFTKRPADDVDERYRALGGYLASQPCPVFANFEWIDEAIIVGNQRWPILQMEWIDGQPLKMFVRRHLDQPAQIAQLGETWARHVSDLEARAVAHGDLQHGNIIVQSSSAFRLVDLDGVYCSSTRPFGTSETGLPAYQHPDRARRRVWDQHIDRFSSIVIYVSLRALASAPSEQALAPGDALILSADDIQAASEQDARDEAWEFLLNSPEREVRALADGLHAACRSSLEAVPSLDEIVRHVERADGGPVRPPASVEGREAMLNDWGPPVATPSRIDNQWGAPAPPVDGGGKRTKPEASRQGWADGGEEHRRVTQQLPQQGWGGAQQQPPAKQPPAGQPAAARAAGTDKTLAAVAIVVGLLLAIGGVVLAGYDLLIGFESASGSGEPDRGQFWFGGVVALAAGVGMIKWAAEKLK